MSLNSLIRVQLQINKIDSQNILDAIEFARDPECGAVNTFLGCTRSFESNDPEKRKVISLNYEAYEEMALKTMKDLVEDICLNYSEVKHRVFVSHKLGRVDLGEISLLIAVGSPHRQSGHELTMLILNEIKRKVPIFKKILFENKDFAWSDSSEAYWIDSVQCKH